PAPLRASRRRSSSRARVGAMPSRARNPVRLRQPSLAADSGIRCAAGRKASRSSWERFRACPVPRLDCIRAFAQFLPLTTHASRHTTCFVTSDKLQQLFKMLDRQPRDAFLLYGLGMEYKKLGDPSKAIEYFDKVIEVDPNYCYAYYQKGQVQ